MFASLAWAGSAVSGQLKWAAAAAEPPGVCRLDHLGLGLGLGSMD